MRRLTMVAALAATLGSSLAAPALEAQQAERDGRFPRKYLYAIVGAVLGGAVAYTYVASEGGNKSPGSCTDTGCVLAFSMGGGALVGFMIGREFDQLYALRYRFGRPLEPPTTSAGLLEEPLALAVSDSLVAVSSAAGVQLFRARDGLAEVGRRAGGVRGIGSLGLGQSGALVIGSAAGFYLYPPGTAPGVLLRPGAAAAAATLDGRVLLGTGTRVEIAPLSADTARTWPGIELGRTVQALGVDEERRLVWAAAEGQVIALRPVGDSLERVGSFDVDAPVRRLDAQGDRLALALGDQGVRILDVADPARAAELMRWGNARFAYDIALAGPRAFVAAGVEGVYVLEDRGGTLVPIGLARELGFATALDERGGLVYVVDRNGETLRRIPASF